MPDNPPLRFENLAELEQMLDQIGLGLHARNRVHGESQYLWHLAELIRAAGRLATLWPDDPRVAREFGDAYRRAKPGEVTGIDRVLELLMETYPTRRPRG